jgi:hypothetical protein
MKHMALMWTPFAHYQLGSLPHLRLSQPFLQGKINELDGTELDGTDVTMFNQ